MGEKYGLGICNNVMGSVFLSFHHLLPVLEQQTNYRILFQMSCRNLTSGNLLNCPYGCCSLTNGKDSCCELRNFFMHGIVIFGAFCFFVCLFCLCHRWKSRRTSNSDRTPVLRAEEHNQSELRTDQTAHNTAVENGAPPTYSAIFGNQEQLQVPTEHSEGDRLQHRSGLNNVNGDNTETSTLYTDESRVYTSNNVVTNNEHIVSNSDDLPDYATYVKEHGLT